jgi:hypothetical protein
VRFGDRDGLIAADLLGEHGTAQQMIVGADGKRQAGRPVVDLHFGQDCLDRHAIQRFVASCRRCPVVQARSLQGGAEDRERVVAGQQRDQARPGHVGLDQGIGKRAARRGRRGTAQIFAGSPGRVARTVLLSSTVRAVPSGVVVVIAIWLGLRNAMLARVGARPKISEAVSETLP